jgi:hypothetical protein
VWSMTVLVGHAIGAPQMLVFFSEDDPLKDEGCYKKGPSHDESKNEVLARLERCKERCDLHACMSHTLSVYQSIFCEFYNAVL